MPENGEQRLVEITEIPEDKWNNPERIEMTSRMKEAEIINSKLDNLSPVKLEIH